MCRLLVISLTLILTAAAPAWALRQIDGSGRAWPIAEKSQSREIEKQYKAASKKKPGSKALEKKRIVRLEKPLATARRDASRMVDITYTLPFDLKDAEGSVIHPKGYRHNPLDNITMTSLIVIDGEKKEHIGWAKQRQKELPGAKILICKGSFITVWRKHRLRVYHLKDQMAERFKIEKAPCTVVQQGDKLLVRQYRCPAI